MLKTEAQQGAGGGGGGGWRGREKEIRTDEEFPNSGPWTNPSTSNNVYDDFPRLRLRMSLFGHIIILAF